MKDNSQPKLLPLIFIIIGSCLLALPGAYGTIFLFLFAGEAGPKDPYLLLLPLPPIIGFLLLFGYIWTAVTKRFVAWLWAISFLFNLIVSLVSGLAMFYYSTEAPKIDNEAILFILFPLWTIFVTLASGYYFGQARAATKANLP